MAFDKSIFWVIMGSIFMILMTVNAIWGDNAQMHHYEYLMWFCGAVYGILRKLSSVAERFENAQRLQNISARVLRPTPQPKDY